MLAALLVLLVVLLGAVVMMGGGPGHEHRRGKHGVGNAEPSRPAQSPVATTGGRTQNPDEFGPQTIHIGDTGADSDIRFQVNSLSCGKKHVGDDNGSYLTAYGTFCVADVRVTNAGNDPRTLSFQDQKLYATDGKSYPSSPYEPRTFPGHFLFEKLDPDQTTSGPIVFDIPESAKADHLVLRGDGSGRGLTVDL